MHWLRRPANESRCCVFLKKAGNSLMLRSFYKGMSSDCGGNLVSTLQPQQFNKTCLERRCMLLCVCSGWPLSRSSRRLQVLPSNHSWFFKNFARHIRFYAMVFTRGLCSFWSAAPGVPCLRLLVSHRSARGHTRACNRLSRNVSW